MYANSNALNNTFLERSVRRMLPFVLLILLLFVIIGSINIISFRLSQLNGEHATALDRASLNLEAVLNDYIEKTSELSNAPGLRRFAETLDNSFEFEAVQDLSSLMRLNLDDYLAIRYITTSGTVRLELLNERNQPRANMGVSRVDRAALEDDAFLSVLRLPQTVVSISDFQLQRGANGLPLNPTRMSLFLYYPLLSDNAGILRGIIQVELDAERLLNTVNNANNQYFNAVAGRSMLLFSNADVVVADSSNPSGSYRANIEAVGGNTISTALYTDVAAQLPNLDAGNNLNIEIPYILSTRPLMNLDGARALNWQLVMSDLGANVLSQQVASVLLLISFVIFTGLGARTLLRMILRPVLAPVAEADELLQNLAGGQTVGVMPSADDPLVEAVGRISVQMDELTQALSTQISRRNRDLQVAGRIGRETATLDNLDTLLRRSINMICSELGFYHAQVFLVDELGTNAVLAYSRGDAGRQLLEKRHRLAVGSPTVIGTVTSEKRPVIINDTLNASEHAHAYNPLLPDTRAEMGLPLIIGDQVLGALDLQSKEPNVFAPEDIPILQLLADQLAIAIYNAQLKQQSDRRISQIDRLNRQLTREAWQGVDEAGMAEMHVGDSDASASSAINAAISIRGEIIGTMNAALPEGQDFTEGDRSILQAVAERVALAIENARLFQETQFTLAETSALYDLSRQLNEANSLQEVVWSIINVIAADATGGQIWLFEERQGVTYTDVARLASDWHQTGSNNQANIVGGLINLNQHSVLAELNSKDISIFSNIDTQFEANLAERFSSLNTRSLLFIPLIMRGVWKGFITLGFAQTREFKERDIRIFRALIVQAGVAIDNRLLQQQTEEALQRNEKLYTASRIINTAESIAELINAVVQTASAPYLDFGIAMLEGATNRYGWPGDVRVVGISHHGNFEERNQSYHIEIPDDSPLLAREPIMIHDEGYERETNTSWLMWMRQEGHSFMVGFPMYSENRPLAMFMVVSNRVDYLSEEDIEVYKALSGQMSTQIENQRLLERTETALAETRRLYIASRAIAAAADLTSIYDAAAGHLAMPFIQSTQEDVFISITILLARPEPRIDAPELEYVFYWASTPQQNTAYELGAILNAKQVPLGKLLSDSPEDVLRLPMKVNRGMIPSNVRHLMLENGIPHAAVTSLRSGQRWYGAVICRTDHANLINDDYVRFMQAIADQIAGAIERQTLLLETERERANLTAVLSTLPAGVLVLDPVSLQPVQHNQRVEELLGRSIDYDRPFNAEEYQIYRSGTDVFYPDNALPVMQAISSNQAASADDISIITDDGETDLLVNAAPIFNQRGEVRAIVAAFQDIGNLRRLETTLQDSLQETIGFYEMQRSLAEANNLDEVLDTLLMQLVLRQPDAICLVINPEQSGTASIQRTMGTFVEDIRTLDGLLTNNFMILNSSTEMKYLASHVTGYLNDEGFESLASIPMRSRTREVPLGWIILLNQLEQSFTEDDQRQLVTVGDMSATALDNTYLVQSTQNALNETASLYKAATSISRARDLNELSSALEEALATLKPDMIAALLIQQEDSIELFKHGWQDAEDRGLDLHQLVQIPIASSENTYVADLTRGTLGNLERELLKVGGLTSVVVVNLRIKDDMGGRIFLGFKEAVNIRESEMRFLNTIADSASVVLDNQVLLEQIQETLQETSVLYQASRALIEVSDPHDIIDVVVNYLIEPHIDQIFIGMISRASWDDPRTNMEIVAAWHVDGESSLEGIALKAEQFPAWEYLASDSVTTINDIYDPALNLDPTIQASFESLEARSVVLLPLRVPSRSIGVLWISSTEPFKYNEQQQRIYQALAEQASLTLEAARLLTQTERRARQLETSAVISQSIGQLLDLNVLMPQMVDLIRDQFGYDHVQIFLMDEDDDYAVLRASTGEAGRQLLKINHRLRKGSGSVIGRVTQDAVATIALDTADANVVHRPNPYLPLTRSEMALPLIAQNKVVGALDVQSNQSNAFTEEDIQALTTLAAQISVAIDNARLYEEAAHRASDMSFLFDLTTAAAAADTLDTTLQTICEQLYGQVSARAVVIYLPQLYVDYNDNSMIMMKAVAASGSDQPLSELEQINLDDDQNIIAIASRNLQAIILDRLEDKAQYLPVVADSRSAIAMPISASGDIIGLIVLESPRAGAYGDEMRRLLQTLAGSLAAIIQNTQLVEQLQSSNDKLREVDRLKSQFLASMSHELRTPLNSIIGFSRVMLKGIDGPLTEMQEQDLTTIYNSGNHLLNLINDILDQAKIEANQLNLKFGYFDVKAMVEGVRSMAIGLMKEKTLNLHIELAPNMPKAYGDEFRSRQILLNLVTNAIKFTPEGTVSIIVYPQTNAYGKLVIQLDVVDTGIGIAEKDMPILFEQFRQIDSSLTRTVGGTGLGLPISKSLSELQGGELSVKSQVNVGSTFTVTIPTEPTISEDEDEDESGDHSAGNVETPTPHVVETTNSVDTNPVQNGHGPATSTQSMPALPPKREVLLIEDDKNMVDQYRRILQREGFEVQTADHPAYAQAMVSNLRPTVVVMDVNFGEGQGWAILEQLKERDDTFDIPVVITTLSAESEKAYRMGAHTFVQRPFTPESLVEAVRGAELESNRERILIIDDQPDAIRLLSQLLDQHGDFRVFSAGSGLEGISLVARRRPDLIILDLRMPDMDGFAVLDELRANPETAAIPVLVVTGELDLQATEEAQLKNLRVLRKTDISQEDYEQFISYVRNQLTNQNRK